MPLRRHLADAMRRRLVPTAAELDELRERVRIRETELAEARQRIRSLERELDRVQADAPKVSAQVREAATAPAEVAPGAAPEATAAPLVASRERLSIVDEDCVGCGTCVDLAPDAFQMDRARAIAEVVSQDAPADQVQEAVDACPTLCIRWGES